MQRTIIAVWGTSNSGKTTAIHLAFDELLNCGELIDAGQPARKEVRAAVLTIEEIKSWLCKSRR